MLEDTEPEEKSTPIEGLSGLTAAILAGGLGTRLRPVVADRPKVLAQVGGRPFLAYLLDQLAVAGIKNVVLCTGYLSEQVQAEFGASYHRLHLSYSQEPAPLGTAGALRLALPRFQSDSVLTMNGDSFCEVDLSAFWSWHRMRGAEATVLLTRMPDTRRYGRVAVSAEGRLLRFDEKDANGGPGWINTGIYLLSLPLLQTIPMGQAVSLEREMFPAWLGRGIYGYQSEARFLDIGTPESYAAAEQFFARTH